MNVNSQQRAIASIALLLCLVFLSLLVVAPPAFNSTDLPAWGRDAEVLECMIKGVPCGASSKFPAAYLINAFVIDVLGSNRKQYVLLVINAIFIIFSVLFVRRNAALKYKNIVTVAYVSALICSPLLPFYTYSGALEIQYGILLGVFCVCLFKKFKQEPDSQNNEYLLITTLFLLPLYKDFAVIQTALAFVVALLFASPEKCLSVVLQTLRSNRGVIVKMLVSLCLSLIVVTAYNSYRWGSLLPLPYITEGREASPPFFVKLQYFFWIFFSPNGGLLITWFAPFVILLALLWSRCLRPSAISFLFFATLLLPATFFLANWWTPFGWEGWGNRLILPTVVAGFIILSSNLYFNAKNTIKKKFFGCSYWKFTALLAALFVFVSSILYTAVTYSPRRMQYLEYSLWGGDSCKIMREIRDRMPMWEFKKDPVYISCHFERFGYFPGSVKDISPLKFLNLGVHPIVNGNGLGVLGSGWSHIESDGVWSDGNNTQIRFLHDPGLKKIVLDLEPFLYGSTEKQKIIVSLGGAVLYENFLTAHSHLVLDLPQGVGHGGVNLLSLNIMLPDAVSPSAVGLNSDKRLLGVKLKSLTLE